MTFGSLFAGIGGMDLGLERAGMVCKWQCEIDSYARRVLEKHWPAVPKWDDVRTFPPACGEWGVDLICGGFPCQDISNAGKRIGIDGERSGLWSEFARIIRVLRPRFVLVENVSALLERGLGRVLGDLASSGYDAEWSILSACAMGAPHMRQRVFILAHGGCLGWEREREVLAPKWERREQLERLLESEAQMGIPAGARGRMSDGLPNRVDRLRGLGNAVVPQVAEWIGRRILESVEESA
jgi:DNA (cytosine-5)-methyltransferase 1